MWILPLVVSFLSRFTITRAKHVLKVALTLQTIPLARQGPFNNITDWYIFRTKLIEEFGSIDISGRDINQTFDLLPRNEFVQEVAEDLSPKIKTLLANLELARNSTTRRTSTELSSPRHWSRTFWEASLWRWGCPSILSIPRTVSRQCPTYEPDTFLFFAQFVDKLEKNYRSNLYLHDLNLTPSSIGGQADQTRDLKYS